MRRTLFALLALLFATPVLAQPATTTAPGTLLTSPLTLQPASRSQSGWTSSGGRYANPSVTLTDTTTAAGTQANGYTDLFSGDTIATQTNAVTFTNYYGSYHTAPVAGTHVTMTNKWALGADSAKINGALTVTGASTLSGSITATGLSSGTQVSCLGLSSANAVVLTSSACGLVASVTNGDGTLTVSPTAGAVVASINLNHINTWTGAFNTFTGNHYIGGPIPYVNVLSGAHGCAAADNTGATDASVAINCYITWVGTNNPDGIVHIPCGTYLLSTTGLFMGSSSPFNAQVEVEGEGINCTVLTTNGADTRMMTWGGTGAAPQQTYGGFRDMTLIGCQTTSCTKPLVQVDNWVGMLIDRNLFVGGCIGLLFDGAVDNQIRDNIIQPAGATGGETCGGIEEADSANWFFNNKVDTGATASGFAVAILGDSTGVANNAFEHHYTRTDMSGSYNVSLYINDSANATIAIFNHPILGASNSGALGAIVDGAAFLSIIGGELSPITANSASNIAITGSVAVGSPFTVTGGTHFCAANKGITC